MKFEWDKKYQEAFDILKEKLNTFSILRPLNWSLLLYVLRDASFVAIGSTLCQASGKKSKDYPTTFASRQLNPTKKKLYYLRTRMPDHGFFY